MLKVNFYKLGLIKDSELRFAVIVAKHNGKWVFVRHKERETWEIPGGHREINENIEDAASRELKEETGAIDFNMIPVCIYSVERDKIESFGQLFYSEISNIGELPNSEIGEIKLIDSIPNDLTYPLIQPYLLKKVQEYYVYSK
ncbi:DNA mismatch repair protein MutT [Clostridium zeae]|uniref:DNA mismatch repair protein MutT n=1 Tax=Clostridium zeae TaxID=2759022 RepID=A0ABQ1EE76_9CLOT|nr:NUDIX domain-containing protein [Clostridium zeae]GFZ32954.1 DNA mismatch repair protein MutT [Clostridium zeae]